MKKNLPVLSLFAFLLVYSNTMAQNPIPNNGFENWSGGEPVEWQSGNGPATFITQATPGHSGNYAARGDVQEIFGFTFPPLLASTGQGFTVNQGYSTLYFFYKFNQVGSPNFFVTVNFFDAADQDAGYGVASISNSVSDYTLGSAAITITGVPVRCIITASILDVSGFPALGNYFILDDLSFDNIIGVPSIAHSGYFINPLIPNPTSNFTTLTYTIPEPTDIDLKIYDLFGRQLKLIHTDHAPAGENHLNIDLPDLSKGTYIVVLTSEFGILQKRIVLQH